MKNKINTIILNYCAYSAIGRICLRFPGNIADLLTIFEKHNTKQEIIKNVNNLNKQLVPLTLVLLKHLKKIDYLKLNYLFKENNYLEIYFEKIIFNKKLNKKDKLISRYVFYLFKIPNMGKINQLRLERIMDFINNSNILERTKTKIKFIFLRTIKGISCGYGNFNYVIIESNTFPEQLIIHEIIHNYNQKYNFKTKNTIEFEEIFTNVISQAIYCKYKKKPVVFEKYYYSTKKEQKLEDIIRKSYFEWLKHPEFNFLDFLEDSGKIFIGKEGITWTFNDSLKFKKLVKEAIKVK